MYGLRPAVIDVAEMLRAAGASVEVFTYPGVRHFFTDPGTADHDEAAAHLALRRGLDFVRRV